MECHLEQRLCRASKLKPLQTQTEQITKRQGCRERELVKYMSKLPGFLEKTEAPQDKPLNVGVLNWDRLEKWQYSNKKMSEKSSTLVSHAKESSSLPRKVQTCSTRHQSKHRNHPMLNPTEEESQITKAYDECKSNFKGHHKNLPRLDQLCENKDLSDEICSKSESLSNGLSSEVDLNREVKSKTCRTRRRKKNENKLVESRQNHYVEEVGHSVVKGHRRRQCTQASCPGPCKADDSSHTEVKCKIGSAYADKVTANKEAASPTRSKGKEDKRSALLHMKHRIHDHGEGQYSKLLETKSEKARDISPFRRLRSKMRNNNSEREVNPATQLESIVNSTMSRSQIPAHVSGVDDSDNKNPNGQDRDVTSPFRRQLEPQSKPKATRTQRSQRVKLGISGCKTVNVNDSAYVKRLEPSRVQAILKITMKNNQPLFTFSVNKKKDILAATLKQLGNLEENRCSGIYTFFSIQEGKKKGVWINQRSKIPGNGIISNVIAQMQIWSSSSGATREFILFSVDLGEGNEDKSDFRLKDELAAIVIKMPTTFISHACRNTVENHNDEGDNCVSATVILQSGVHSLPHKGGPSSLIQRWRSGGSCDCGGWDMGCNLRVLSNKNPSTKCSSSSSIPLPSSDRFDFFFLGGRPEEQPFLSLIRFKEGMYRVGYNSSLSLLQAFSICVAVAESSSILFSETLQRRSSYNEPKTSDQTSLVPDQEARYAACPPLSPVGRV